MNGFYTDEDGADWFRFGDWVICIRTNNTEVGAAIGAWDFGYAQKEFGLELVREIREAFTADGGLVALER